MANDFILQQKAKQWHDAVQYIQKKISNYTQGDVSVFDDLLMAVTENSVKPMYLTEKCKLLSTFANQIAIKDSELSTRINQFVGICESIYCHPEKFNEFKKILQEKGWTREWDKRKEEEQQWQKEQDRKRQEEQMRKAREREEERRRKEQQKKWEEQQERNRREQEQREYEQKRARARQAQEREHRRRKNRRRTQITVLIAGLVIILALAYQYVYVPYTIDRNAARTYVFATNLFLRSSKVTDVEYNRIGKIPYGSELITYSNHDGWAEVKVNGQKGFVSSDYLLDYTDFHLLNGIWGNEDAKETVTTAKCRLAILDYLKSHELKTGRADWSLYTKNQAIKPNSVFFPRLANGYNNFSDFAFILTNNTTKERKLILYSFTENEHPVFVYEEQAPQKGDIKNIAYTSWNQRYKVSYSTNSQSATNERATPTPIETKIDDKEIIITNVVFANGDYYNNILTPYGSTLYSNMQYLMPKVYYKGTSHNHKTIKLQIKLYAPDKTLIHSTESPLGYTIEETVEVKGKENCITSLRGWGNKEGRFYTPGIYTYEIWCDGIKLYQTSITVVQDNEKTEMTEDEEDNQVYVSNVQMPQYPEGGLTGAMQYIRKNIKYPAIAQENGIQGNVTVSFIVEKDGSITNITVAKGINPYLDKEAIRVVSSMPKWNPGIRQGKVVRCKYVIPVSFKLI